VTWSSKMQTEVLLCTTEADLIVMRECQIMVITLMRLIEEMAEQIMRSFYSKKVHCKVFEDNVGAMTITTMHKIRLRTKKINGKFWLLRENLEQGIISVHALSTKDQITDLLTKPLAENEFNELKKIMGKESDDMRV